MLVLAALALYLTGASGIRIRDVLLDPMPRGGGVSAESVNIQMVTIESYVGLSAAAECVVQYRGQTIAGTARVGNNTLVLPTQLHGTQLATHGVTLQCASGITALDASKHSLKFKLIPLIDVAATSWVTLLVRALPLLLAVGISTGALGVSVVGYTDRRLQSQDFIRRRRLWLLKHSEPEGESAALLMDDLHEALASFAIGEEPALFQNTDTTLRLPTRAHRLLIQKIAGEFTANLVHTAVHATAATHCATCGPGDAACVTREEFMRVRRSLRKHIDCQSNRRGVKVSVSEVEHAARVLRCMLAASPGCSSASA